MRYDPQLISCRANDTTSTDVASHFYLLEYHRKRLHEAAQFFDAQTSLHLPKLDYLEDSGSFRTLLYDRIAEYAKVEQPQSSDEKGICNAKLQSVHGYKDNQEVLLPTIPLRIRLALHRTYPKENVDVRWTIQPIDPLPLSTLFPSRLYVPTQSEQSNHTQWRPYLDHTSTQSKVTTTFKTSERTAYTAAYDRVVCHLDNVTGDRPEVITYDQHGNVSEGTFTSVYFLRENHWVTPRVISFGENWDVKEWLGGQRGTSRRWALDNGLCVEGDVAIGSIQEGECVWLSNGCRGFGFGFLRKCANTQSTISPEAAQR